MSQPLSSLESLNLADWNLLIKLLLKPVLTAAPRDLIPLLVGASLNGLSNAGWEIGTRMEFSLCCKFIK